MKFHKFNAKTILQNQSSTRDLLIRTYVTLIKSSNDEIFTLIVKFEGFYQGTFFKRHFSTPFSHSYPLLIYMYMVYKIDFFKRT